MRTGLQAQGPYTDMPVLPPIRFVSSDAPAAPGLASGLAVLDIAKEAPSWQNVLQSLYGDTTGRLDCLTTLGTNTNDLTACAGHRSHVAKTLCFVHHDSRLPQTGAHFLPFLGGFLAVTSAAKLNERSTTTALV